MSSTNQTLDYYNNHAQEFFDKTFSANVSSSRDKFLARLTPGAHILDVGCGSGRDTLHFLQAGFQATAFDASESVAQLAQSKINHPVQVLKIEDMTWEQEFDGVWAMASLLHLPKKDMAQAIANCAKALKSEGVLFVSLKIGSGESLDENNRFFSYYTPTEIQTIFESSGLFQNVAIDTIEDTLGRPGLSWVNIVAVAPEYVPTLSSDLKSQKNNNVRR